MSNVGDLERILSRAATGKILPREVMQLGRSLEQTDPVAALCRGRGVAELDRMVGELRGCGGLLSDIRRTMAANPAAQLGKGDIIAPGVDAELDELRDISRGGKDYLLQMQQREIERTGISSLKIGYNNVFGYYIEVRNTFKDKVPEEWIRKQTLVNAERYITEELKVYEEKILSAEGRIYELESRIYSDLVREIQSFIRDIQANCQILARLDVLSGFADLAADSGYCRPVMTDGLALDIRAGRHPVIEKMMGPGEEYVPNDVYLDADQQQIIILTGPNMAGKSALLRQTALIVLMAQVGSWVPADSATIGYFDKIFTRVGASDNISRGESTFMVEMLETAMIMHNLSERSLVLLDEIGRGTSTYDGMSIARALVEYLHEHGHRAKTLFATHYHELNDLESIYPRVKNFHIAVKEAGKQVIFLRKLKEGGVAHSFGIHVARLAGMPREVLDSAERTLAQLEGGSTPRVYSVPSEKERIQPAVEPEETPGFQLSLFQLDDPTLGAIRDKLNAADLDNMTPMQAFDLLRSMKAELGL
jgi:DNA mismatch repair protein MutS